ncbi:hypothetical protein ACJX0J_012689, partial [Zea mays]
MALTLLLTTWMGIAHTSSKYLIKTMKQTHIECDMVGSSIIKEIFCADIDGFLASAQQAKVHVSNHLLQHVMNVILQQVKMKISNIKFTLLRSRAYPKYDGNIPDL